MAGSFIIEKSNLVTYRSLLPQQLPSLGYLTAANADDAGEVATTTAASLVIIQLSKQTKKYILFQPCLNPFEQRPIYSPTNIDSSPSWPRCSHQTMAATRSQGRATLLQRDPYDVLIFGLITRVISPMISIFPVVLSA